MWTKVGIVLALTVAAFGSPIDDDERIIGGITAAPGDVAFMVSIRDRDNIHYCGGSIIGNNKVLTAASCILAMPGGQRFVHSGSVDLGGGDQHRVSSSVPHPDYAVVNGTPVNDIAVVHTQSNFMFGEFTGSAVIPPQGSGQIANGTMCTIAGWGSTSLGGGGSNVLLTADLPVVDWFECATLYEDLFILDENVVCAGFPEGGVDSCTRDDGGPLFVLNGLVVGVYTYGGLCGLPNRPGIYTQVSAYTDWINAN